MPFSLTPSNFLCFKVDKVLEHLLLLLEKSDLRAMLGFWNYLDIKFFSRLEARFAKSVRKFEVSLLRYYLVYAVQHNRREKVTEFFELLTPELTGNPDWTTWFCTDPAPFSLYLT